MSEAENAKLRARAAQVMAAVRAQAAGPISIMTRFGEVQFEAVAQKTDADGRDYIDIRLRGQTESGDPHFRVYYPPLFVPDLLGPVEQHGQRYREDPLTALAEVVARGGGQQKDVRP